MLGKLLKYDIKSTFAYFGIIHGVLLVFCIFGRFFITERFDFVNAAPAEVSTLLLFGGLFFLLFLITPFATYLILAIRFYRNLFTDEGYLTLTIPATRTQLLWSKLIFAALTSILDTLLVALGLLILTYTPNTVAAYLPYASDFAIEMGMSLSQFLQMLFAIAIISSIFNGVSLYFCITVGQLLPHHPIIGAILTYFASSLLIEIITFGFLFAFEIFPSTYLSEATNTASITYTSHYYQTFYTLTGILTLVVSAVEYVATHYILTHKLNLN
ncbi:MAG: hypothetical protein HFH53_08010 [Hespellia sp.]|nr:hypothetical protein [Hespellia sp.]